jgi:hypothetical protein
VEIMADFNMGPFKPNPKGKYDPSAKYKYFDSVEFDGGWYLNINRDEVDGISCIGILPEGQAESELYWMCLCRRGNDGKSPDAYLPFITIDETGIWDYSLSDKAIVPKELDTKLTINNAYDGCCGIIVTDNANLELPDNSDCSIDFGYIDAGANQYYMYTFICMPYGEELKFLWNRTVMNNG